MDFERFKQFVKEVRIGKHLPEAIYLHHQALEYIPEELLAFINRANDLLKIENGSWNLLKLYKRDFKYSLLYYPGFFDDAYPALNTSFTIDLTHKTYRKASYADSKNPPILHRKETFLPADHPNISEFNAITQEAESIGLHENTRIIGFKQSWERLIRRKGYQLLDNRLVPLSNLQEEATGDNIADDGTINIHRHKTALSRDKLSVPMQLLSKRGYLNREFNVLDYGCGKGDDLRELEAHHIDAIGWDPVYRPEIELETRDIVNLGFVINVIEDRDEREIALGKAYGLADKLLVVSAMLGNEETIARFEPYKDGVITRRNTFQKYYAQPELKNYIESSLETNAIAVAPGIFFVFKDKVEEQNYLLARQKARFCWRQLTSRPRTHKEPRVTKQLVEKHEALFGEFWQILMDLGRAPGTDEYEGMALLRQAAGSLPKALDAALAYFGAEHYQQAQQQRKDDLAVYFALGFFGKRQAYARMPEGLQRDIKAFYGKYSNARECAKELLFSVSNPEIICHACLKAYGTLPASHLEDNHSLTLHRQYLNGLPKELRTYIGCATQLYGDLDDVDLIKVHIRSGKVSLMIFDDFENKPIPLLKERIKIKLREQDIDFFDYVGPYTPTPLYSKSSLIDESFPNYKKQVSFDRRLAGIVSGIEGYLGPNTAELNHILSTEGIDIKGYRFYKRKS